MFTGCKGRGSGQARVGYCDQCGLSGIQPEKNKLTGKGLQGLQRLALELESLQSVWEPDRQNGVYRKKNCNGCKGTG